MFLSEADLGRYLTCLTSAGKDYAIFSEGNGSLTMYEIEQDDSNPYGFPTPCPVPARLKQDSIPVYRASREIHGQEDLERLLASQSPACEDPLCQYHPARSMSLLEVKEEVLELPSPPWQHPSTVKGYMETSWTMRTADTPPPYVRIDNRRKPQTAAYVLEEELPVSPPHSFQFIFPTTTPLPTTHQQTQRTTPTNRPTVIQRSPFPVYQPAHDLIVPEPPSTSPRTIERNSRATRTRLQPHIIPSDSDSDQPS